MRKNRREENVMRKNGSQGEGTVERREGGKKRATKGVRRDGGQREGIWRKGMVRRERKVVRIKGWWAEGGKGGEKGW